MASSFMYSHCLHDALPILFADRLNAETQLSVGEAEEGIELRAGEAWVARGDFHLGVARHPRFACPQLNARSEEHTSELQSRRDLVCRLLLEKKTSTRQILN